MIVIFCIICGLLASLVVFDYFIFKHIHSIYLILSYEVPYERENAKNIEYEVLNVANEVVFTGSGPDTLTWCNENKNIANTVREVGNSKVPALKMEVWCWLAGLVQNAIEKREEKKKKKEAKKKWRKKEKSFLSE